MTNPPLDLGDISRHLRGLSRLAGSLLDDEHAGEDVAQESAVRALRSERRPTERAEVGPWLRTIAQRLTRNEWRSRRHRADREREAAVNEHAPSSAEIAQRAETAERLHAAVRELPPELSTALLDRYVGDLTPTAIAQRDSVSVNTVKARLRRAKAALRTKLDRDGLHGNVGPVGGNDLRGGEHWSIALAPLALASKSAWCSSDASASAAVSTTGAIAATIMMKTILVGGTLAALGLALFHWSGGQANVDRGTLDPSTARVGTEPAPRPILEHVADNTLAQRSAAPRSPALTTSDDTPATRIHGRVVDSQDTPIVGARVEVTGTLWDGTASRDLPIVTAATDEQGAFDVAVPIVVGAKRRLRVFPDEFHVRHEISFGEKGHNEFPSLGADSLDVGVFRLASAGSATGRVLSLDGTPIADAWIVIGPDYSGYYHSVPMADTTTAVDGSYTLAHVPIGDLDVRFSAPGFATTYRAAVAFSAGQRATLGDITLDPAGKVKGRVVDEGGEPVPRAFFFINPVSRIGAGTHTWVGDDGRFEVQLMAVGAHEISLDQRGFEPLGVPYGDPFVVEPGSSDVQVVLTRLPQTTFEVVDSLTGQPIEEFGLRVGKYKGSQAPDRVHGLTSNLTARSHSDGSVTTGARPGIDRVFVEAPGYDPFKGDVEHNVEFPKTQRISLRPGVTVTGMVTRNGSPTEGAAISVRRIERRGTSVVDVEAACDSTGAYALNGLTGGTYEISASIDALNATTVIRTDSAVLDSGGRRVVAAPELLLAEPGSIRGTVLLPAGVSADGLSVSMDDSQHVPPTPLRVDGTFHFDGVPQGVHALLLDDYPGRVSLKIPSAEVTVAPGLTTHVSIDATKFGVTTLDLTIEVTGHEPSNVKVVIAHDSTVASQPGEPKLRSRSRRMHPLDAQGRVRFSTRASGFAFPEISVGDLPSLVVTDAPLALEPGTTVEQLIVFNPAKLELVFPDEVEALESATYYVDLHHPAHADSIQTYAVTRTPAPRGHIEFVGQTVTLPFVPAGALHVAVRSAQTQLVEYEAEVALRPGELTRVVLQTGDD